LNANCWKCNKRLDDSRAANPIECTSCKSLNPKKVKKCWNCGAAIEIPEPEPPQKEEPAKVATEEPAKELPKGVCPKCGTKNAVTRKFCSNCGANLTDEVKCPFCSATNKKDEKFCGECGKPLASVPPKPTGPTCPKCETLLDSDSSFCPGCGFNMVSVEVKQRASEKYPLPPGLGLKSESEDSEESAQGEPVTAAEIRGLELMADEKVLHKVTTKRMFDMITPPSVYVTNYRVIRRVPKTLGLRSDIQDWMFQDMANVKVNKGLLGSDIEIIMRFNSERFKIEGLPKAETKTLHTLIRYGILGKLR